MELIAITTFLTFANISGVAAAAEGMDRFQVEQAGVVTIEEVNVTSTNKPRSLLEAFNQSRQSKN